jgi:integral membrane protein (TIGR00529 family)
MSTAILALGKLCLALIAMIIGLRLHLGLWLCVLLGAVCAVIVSGLPLTEFVEIVPQTALNTELYTLLGIILLTLLISGVQEATGQSTRLVAALEQLLRSPHLRLIFFPALIGLLPMPGGALFSCPMLDGAARRMDLGGERKAAINYWFRHIWEVAWPLYPGYLLACAVLDIPLSVLWRYTFPIVFTALLAGRIFLLRSLPPEHREEIAAPPIKRGKALAAVFIESLPITVALLGAFPASVLVDTFFPLFPKGMPFLFSLGAAVVTAILQGRGGPAAVVDVLLKPSTRKLFLLLFTIFLFKTSLEHSGLITEISGFGTQRFAVYALCFLLPFLCGLLTGVMMGYVGTSFPILLGVISQAGMQNEAMPLYILALAAGQLGQLLSPIHVCLVVSCEYFKVGLFRLVQLIAPTGLFQFGLNLLWCLLLTVLLGVFGPW